MHRTSLIVALGGLMLFVASAAMAQNGDYGDDDGDKSHGLGLGGRYAYVTNEATDEASHMGGVMGRLRGGALGLEAGVDYHSEDIGADTKVKSWPITVNALVYPFSIVYGLAGVGWYKTTIDYPSELGLDNDTSDDFGYQLGAGVEYPVANAVSLTGDVRWMFVDHEFSEIPDAIGNIESDSWSLNAGLLFYLR
jgi:opacity protein-like surface antigen